MLISQTLIFFVHRFARYIRDYGFLGPALLVVKVFSLIMSMKPPAKPEIVRTRLGGYLFLVPGDRGISAELRRWGIHEPLFTYELLKRIRRGFGCLMLGVIWATMLCMRRCLLGGRGL